MPSDIVENECFTVLTRPPSATRAQATTRSRWTSRPATFSLIVSTTTSRRRSAVSAAPRRDLNDNGYWGSRSQRTRRSPGPRTKLKSNSHVHRGDGDHARDGTQAFHRLVDGRPGHVS